MTYKPKLIEVALPLLKINEAAAAEGSTGQRPHPKNLHRWWARRPLSAARAVVWASLVDDPSSDHSLTTEEQDLERERLFRILEALVTNEGSADDKVLNAARAEIQRSFPDGRVPRIADPFGGGGAIPFEASRLGLSTVSGDLNPIPVLIQRSMLEIPQKFQAVAPVHPDASQRIEAWSGSMGLAEDVTRYGRGIREVVAKEFGHLYPNAKTMDGADAIPIVWIWARTIESPDPSWSGQVPLVASWILSKKAGKPVVWVEPIVDRSSQTISYRVRTGGEPAFDRTVDRGGGTCIATGAAMPFDLIRKRFQEGEVSQSLIAVVAEGPDGRVFLDPSEEQTAAAASATAPSGIVRGDIFDWPGRTNVVRYGMERWEQLFSPRQLVTLAGFSDGLATIHQRVEADAREAGILDDGVRLRDGGSGAVAYADAVVTYLAFAVDKMADFSNTLCSWNQSNSQLRYLFSRQAMAMTWDFAEVNPLSQRMSSWDAQVEVVARALRSCLNLPASGSRVLQRDATALLAEVGSPVVVSTDPPYYDNISYADLADFFFVWLRRSLGSIWPDECATLLTPKAGELIANRYRAGSKAAAAEHFESGMASFMREVAAVQHEDVPATIYYAYKATESKDGEIRSTGWDTFLQAVIDAGLQVTATWPLRTERQGRTISLGANALASSIVLACRTRSGDAPMASRGEFVAALRDELPAAVRVLQTGDIAPVDIPQSTIGPGIGIFSRYSRVIESDGTAMPVGSALAIINDVLGEVLDGDEAEMDKDSRFALAWYSEYGYGAALSGDAINLARAKNTSLQGVQDAGIGETRAGQFRLLRRDELLLGWSYLEDQRPTVWETTQYLVSALAESESRAAQLLQSLGGYGDRARQLSYLLFKKATDKSWADEASSYNGLIAAWPALRAAAAQSSAAPELSFEPAGDE